MIILVLLIICAVSLIDLTLPFWQSLLASSLNGFEHLLPAIFTSALVIGVGFIGLCLYASLVTLGRKLGRK